MIVTSIRASSDERLERSVRMCGKNTALHYGRYYSTNYVRRPTCVGSLGRVQRTTRDCGRLPSSRNKHYFIGEDEGYASPYRQKCGGYSVQFNIYTFSQQVHGKRGLGC